MAAKKPPKVTRFPPPADEQPEKVEAASLALAILGKVKADTWAELVDRGGQGDDEVLAALAKIHITASQQELLERHADVVDAVAVSSPLRTIAVCSQCEEHIVLASGQPPSTCVITLGCEGKYVRATRAKAEQVETAELESEPLPEPDPPPGPETVPVDGELDEDEEPFEF